MKTKLSVLTMILTSLFVLSACSSPSNQAPPQVSAPQDVQQASPAATGETDKISALKAEGDKYLENDEYDKAIETFNKILELDPKNTDATIVVGQLYLNKNELDKALSTYENAISMDPEGSESILVYITMAQVYKTHNEPEKAIEILNKAKEVAEKVQPGQVKFIEGRIESYSK